jgi:hypothetical protein
MEAASSHGHHADCTVAPLRVAVMDAGTRTAGGNVTGDDLIVAAPWLAFAAGLAVIGWRLAISRGRRRPSAGEGTRPPGPPEEADDRPGLVAQNGWPRDR